MDMPKAIERDKAIVTDDNLDAFKAALIAAVMEMSPEQAHLAAALLRATDTKEDTNVQEHKQRRQDTYGGADASNYRP
jgi:hypothetical protein